MAPQGPDQQLVELVDALVEAIDLDRVDAVQRVETALLPYGASSLLNDELRLNGRASSNQFPFKFDVEVV